MIKKYSILLLDDDPLEVRALQRSLNGSSNDILFEVFFATITEKFEEILHKTDTLDFVILDIHLTGQMKNGFQLINIVKKIHPEATLLMSSNLDDPVSVLESLRLGADEFLSKKTQQNNLVQRLLLLRDKTLIKKGYIKKREIEKKKLFSGKLMEKIEQRIPNIIHSAIKFVYVEGESGTGKEVVADLFATYLKDKPFVKLNCAAIPKDLLESELFGHKKGSFTGAHFDKKGVIEAANGGWLFLDEVSSLTPSAQSALLRALENQEVTPIGEHKARKINVCFLSASNIPLANMVGQGLFRNDLWQRLRETEIHLTPLRERKEEIPQLIYYFCKTMDGGPYTIEDTALNVLCQLSWQEGNVRELRNCLRAMTENQNQKILSPMAIPQRVLENYRSLKTEKKNLVEESHWKKNNTVEISLMSSTGKLFTFDDIMLQILKNILDIKKDENGKINLTQLSKELNIARSTLQSKIKIINNPQ